MNSKFALFKKAIRIIFILTVMVSGFISSPEKSVKAAVYKIYVDADAVAGTDTGTSWPNAYLHLQDALDETNASGSTDYEIWVAEGVYYPDEESTGTDHTNNSQNESFLFLYNNVKLYGGFSGGETSLNQRDWETNLTILSGDIDGNDTNTDGNFIAEDWNDISSSNAYHVVVLDGSTNEEITLSTVVDGFTITAGQADEGYLGTYGQKGGGILCYAAGFPTRGECSSTLRNLTIQGNRGDYGGGVALVTETVGVSNPFLTNISMIGNLAANSGGGMWSTVSSDAAGESSPALVNVRFWENYAISWGGGGMYITVHKGTGNPTLTNVEFYNNQTDNYGGGMFVYTNYLGTIQGTLTNVTFSGNQADIGGGLYNDGNATGTYSMDINNTILWGNTATTSGAGIANNIFFPTFTSSDIQGCGGSGGGWDTLCGTDNGGNLDVNPHFANSSAGDLTLLETSPAIDAGDQSLLEVIPLDLGMNNRLENDDVDMGAYETKVIPGTVVADFDGDGDTDVSVYRPSNGRWYIEGQGNFKWGYAGDLPVPGDYDGDGTTDIAIFRPSNGKWYLMGSAPASWGAADDIPLQADYTGDGLTDKAVLRTSTKRWYIEGMGNTKWYLPGDIPVPCDYDGDGSADIAIYRPSNNNWYVMGESPVGWGQSGDIPVPADYDGDGACEIAVFRPSNGKWYVEGIGSTTWGLTDDIPVPGDYDGDGVTEYAVLRPSNGKWYIKDVGTFSWYASGDFPLPVRDTNADGDPYE